MTASIRRVRRRLVRFLALALALVAPLSAARSGDVESALDQTFDRTFGKDARAPHGYSSALEAQIGALASAEEGRIGVAALDLSTGRGIAILGDQPFPMASTSKIAIAATFLDGVDHGRFRLSD